MERIRLIYKDTSGATMVEYGLMLAFIAAVCISAISPLIAQNLNVIFNHIAGYLGGGS